MGTVTLRWVEEKLLVGSDTTGHSVVIGRSSDSGFDWLGMKPSDLLLVAAAACSAYDVIEILTKQREPLEDLKIDCSGEQMSEPPYKFTKIHIHYIVKGDVNPEKLERAIHLSEEKYCSVTNSLDVPVTSDYAILD